MVSFTKSLYNINHPTESSCTEVESFCTPISVSYWLLLGIGVYLPCMPGGHRHEFSQQLRVGKAPEHLLQTPPLTVNPQLFPTNDIIPLQTNSLTNQPFPKMLATSFPVLMLQLCTYQQFIVLLYKPQSSSYFEVMSALCSALPGSASQTLSQPSHRAPFIEDLLAASPLPTPVPFIITGGFARLTAQSRSKKQTSNFWNFLTQRPLLFNYLCPGFCLKPDIT